LQLQFGGNLRRDKERAFLDVHDREHLSVPICERRHARIM
jgi:hypothetical protein